MRRRTLRADGSAWSFRARVGGGSGGCCRYAAVVVDVRTDDRIPARDAETFAVTASACQVAGWEYHRSGDLDPVLAANVRWLSRYRHRRCLVPGIAGSRPGGWCKRRPPVIPG